MRKLSNRRTRTAATLAALTMIGVAPALTGCDSGAAPAEAPAPEQLVDRSAPRGVDIKAEDLLTPAQKQAMAAGTGSIEYPAPFDGKPVTSTKGEDGLIIEDFVVGKGPKAEGNKIVKIHYQGFLTNGFKFDDSHPRGSTLEVKLDQPRMIPGFAKGIVGVQKGGRRRIEIPAALAYGSTGRGPIPPDSTLVFLLEVEDVTDPPPPPKGPEAFAGTPSSTKTLEGGVKVEVHGAGSGSRAAKAGDIVGVHYTGTLMDGTEFDSSLKRGQPINFPLGAGRVIKGWDAGIAGMKVGELRRLTIPADMAYGERARGKIPANATLIFTVELMSITNAPKRPTATPAVAGAAGRGRPNKPG